MSRADEHRAALRSLPAGAWPAYLAERSGLPGPRANLELAQAAADEAPAASVRAWAAAGDEYLALCGAVGLGRLLVDGDPDAAGELRLLAADGRWRVREGVAMGLQRLGDADLPALLALARAWVADPSALVRRAAVAGVCEPRLLRDPGAAEQALDLLDAATASLGDGGADARVLRQALGYCWSVAVAALPDDGFERLERLAGSDDPDVRWVLTENLKKARLARADPERCARLRARVA